MHRRHNRVFGERGVDTMYEYEADYTDYSVEGVQKFAYEVGVKVADVTDKAILEALCEYAKEYAKKKGGHYRLLIIEEEMAKELIELGMRAYMEGKRIW